MIKQLSPLIRARYLWGVVPALALALLAVPPALAQAPASYTVAPDSRGQPTIVVAGAGAGVTLAQIRAGLGASAHLLQDQGAGVWQLNANLLIDRDVTLALGPASGVQELRLRSHASAAPPVPGTYDYASFVYLRTDDGAIAIDGARIHSWDPAAGAVDTDYTNGRSYLLAKYDARLDIANAELSYLGSPDGESYGVSWRDINASASPATLRTRVTGAVVNSSFHHNYYGVYTFQASGILFRGNSFYRNISYGFDPHDFSNNFIVEDNTAYENGNHGFIISRGCYGFVFRRNVSYRNNNLDPLKLAHGFMLDPGSPLSASPQAPSTNNLLENNHAYDNEGYGLRILGSTGNTVRGNRFERNEQGITVEVGSTGNMLIGNTIVGSRVHGIFVRGGADRTMVTENTVTGSGANGIYVKSNGNTLQANAVSASGLNGIATLPETSAAAAAADLLAPGKALDAHALDAELVGEVMAEKALAGNRIAGNTLVSNADDGVELKGAVHGLVEANTIERNGGHGVYLASGSSGNRIERNTITANHGDGIRANGPDVVGNTWSGNLISGNGGQAIRLTGGAAGQVLSSVSYAPVYLPLIVKS
jgi:parallel beta-helix repeat protein